MRVMHASPALGKIEVHINGEEELDEFTYGMVSDWIEVEGPLHESWPPPSHKRIFGNLPQKSAPVYNFRERVDHALVDPHVAAFERQLDHLANLGCDIAQGYLIGKAMPARDLEHQLVVKPRQVVAVA
jgi:hypothetical protein